MARNKKKDIKCKKKKRVFYVHKNTCGKKKKTTHTHAQETRKKKKRSQMQWQPSYICHT